jgi:sulfotransferase family protein
MPANGGGRPGAGGTCAGRPARDGLFVNPNRVPASRSGTALIEQILARHSQVFGAGELSLAAETFGRLAGAEGGVELAFEALDELSASQAAALANWHLDRLHLLNESAPRVADKLPDNYLYLGLLAALFPRASFIHCRRDLRDIAVSCWMTGFRSLRWTSDPEHIVSRFQQYQRLMNHWRTVLPFELLDVDYEGTVSDLETTARRLVHWCGLEWEPACLRFHEGSRPVRTASVSQVRQPIYRRSVGRWRNYEHTLGLLFESLHPIDKSANQLATVGSDLSAPPLFR